MLRSGQRLDKYRIERRLAKGGFAVVYQARDTIEGVRVALKIPHDDLVNDGVLTDFRREVRLTAKLEHPNILPLKNACIVKGHFLIAFPLGQKTLAERLKHRMALRTALDFVQQMLEGVAYAHRHRIIHCDIKPENFILFPGNRLRLTDFGISKVALKTIRASGSGTIGFMAPEQAMGKPSLRSDVFSLGLLIYRMLTGETPEWPYEWPYPGHRKLRGRVPAELVDLLRKATELHSRNRFRDANEMLAAFERLYPKVLRYHDAKRRGGTKKRRRAA